MDCVRSLFLVAGLSVAALACGDDSEPGSRSDASKGDAGADASASDESESDAGYDEGPLAASTVLDLGDVKSNPTDYEFGDFRPNVQKLFLAGSAETQHVAVLWYTVKDGAVGRHYHAKTESVYVIDGTQTDAKGVYPTGTVYFNPPGSGHEIKDSSGFFLLAYASPPDFMSVDKIGEYTPIRIETDADDLTSSYAFEEVTKGVKTYAPELDAEGGMSAKLIETTSTKAYPYTGNYVLVVKGSCQIAGKKLGEDMVVVSKAIEPQSYKVSASKGETCLVMGVSF
jgi:ChrR Cupin-like domain